MASRAGIVVTGTEVLTGRVSDRNGPWLAEQLRVAGVDVANVIVVGDRPDDLRSALRFLAESQVNLIITSGGLGPTDDDMTLRAISRTLNLEMYEHLEALEMVRQRYAYIATIRENFSPDLNDSRRKMAIFPAGGVPLFNPNGAAPGPHDGSRRVTAIARPGHGSIGSTGASVPNAMTAPVSAIERQV